MYFYTVNEALLHPEVQKFIREYTDTLSALAFRGSPFQGVTVQELIQQVEGYRKTKKKLPTWHTCPGIYYPSKLSIEQTSSEDTAKYKASLFSGKSIADISGGFGVDSYFFGKRFEQVAHFELDSDLSQIAAHNFNALDTSNIKCYAGNGIDGILNNKYDVIYVDPARRHESKGKVFFLADCEPNLLEHQKYLLERCDTLLVKTSPMLDISAGLFELENVTEIHVVALENEVKELLWVLRQDISEEIKIKTVNFNKKEIQKFDFIHGQVATTSHSHPKQFLFEPNAALLKAGAFQYLGPALKLDKLHMHSHLFTSEVQVAFPGRSFEIQEVVPYHKKEMKAKLQGMKANVSIRNFSESVQALRKKWKIADGGDTYLFFTTLMEDQKVVLVCHRIIS